METKASLIAMVGSLMATNPQVVQFQLHLPVRRILELG